MAGAICVVVGLLVLTGWALDVPTLESCVPGLPAMKANTALAFVLAGISLLLSQREEREPKLVRRYAALVCALSVTAMGLLTLGEYALGKDFGIDQLLFRDWRGSSGPFPPGRIPPIPSLNLVAVGVGLLLLDVEGKKGRRPTELLALIVSLGAMFGFVDLTYHLGASRTGMAPNGILMFWILAGGLLGARPRGHLVGLLFAEGAGATTTRRLLLVSIMLPPLLGWLRIQGQRAGLFGLEFGASLMVVANVVTLAAVVFFTSQSLDKTDAERRLAEEKSARFREQARLLDLAHDSIVLRDLEGRILFWNRGAEQTYGWAKGEALGRSSYALLNTRFPTPLEEIQRELVREGRWEGELTHTRRDGTSLIMASRWALERDEHGGPLHILEINDDLTGLRHAEAELERFFTLSLNMLCIAGFDGYLKRLNPAWERTLGFTPEELRTEPFMNFVHPDDREATSAEVKKLFAGLETICFENRYRTKDGSYRWMLWNAAPYLDKQLIYAAARDITERKRAEEEQARLLRKTEAAEARFRGLLESAPDAILIADCSGKIALVNRKVEELFGYRREELVGMAEEILVPERLRQAHVQLRLRYYAQPEIRGMQGDPDLFGRRKDGSEFPMEISLSPMRSEGEMLVIAVVRDISERQRDEKALKLSEEQYRDLVENSGVLIGTHDARGVVLSVNREMVELAGYSCAEQIAGRRIPDFLPPNVRHLFDAYLQKVLREGRARGLVRMRAPDGEDIIIEYNNSLRREGLEEPIVRCIGRDVTEQKKAERVLRESEERFRTVANAVPVLIWMSGTDARCSFVNQRWLEFRGRSMEEVVGDGWMEGVHPQDLSRYLHVYHSAFEARASFSMEYRSRRADGEYRWILDSGAPLFSPIGSFCGYIGCCADITERKQVEEQLDELRRQNELILNSAGEGICRIDLDGRCTFVNLTGARMIGWDVDQLVGRDLHQVMHHTRPDGSPYPKEDCPALQALTDGKPRSRREVFWRKDGSSFPAEYTCTPICENNHIVGAVQTFQDITERRSVEQMKDEFISVVGHELRTPLTSIRGALGLLASGHLGELPAKSQRMLEVAVTNTDRLVRLINDILDIERMESGQVSLRKQVCNVSDLIEQALEVMRPMAERADVLLSASPEPVCVEADPDGILQTLTNLLSNAIKFSPSRGTVSLAARRQGDEVLFQIKDRGRGIPPEKIERIFGRFQQVDASDSRERGGTGLGLSICRGIVQRHRGRIWAESQVGCGSTFFFTLPIGRPPAGSGPQGGQEPGSEARESHIGGKPLVLVCDDDPWDRKTVQDLLERRGYRVATVASGEEAVEQATAQKPAIIVLDLMMPGMNGWETTAALKDRADTRNIPIIISSLLSPEESSQPPAHVTAWLRKPLEEGSLTQVLEMALHGE